jgi:hypothetical protein
MSEISKETLDLSAEIGKALTLDGEVFVPAEGTYEKAITALVPDAPMELHERIQAANMTIMAAGMHAVGVKGIEAMEKDPSLNKVTCELPTIGKDTFNFSFERSRQVRASAPGEKDTTMKTKFGIATLGVDIYGAGSRGEVQAVKTFLSDKAADALK